MLFELDKLTTDCVKFCMLRNIGLWRTDSEFEKTVGCFTAALDHLGFKVEIVQLASVHLETHVVRGLFSFHVCMDGNKNFAMTESFSDFLQMCIQSIFRISNCIFWKLLRIDIFWLRKI